MQRKEEKSETKKACSVNCFPWVFRKILELHYHLHLSTSSDEPLKMTIHFPIPLVIKSI